MILVRDKPIWNAIIISMLLCMIYVFIGQVYSEIIYYNDFLFNSFTIYALTIGLSLLYSIPIIFLYKNRYWYISLLILVLYIPFMLLFISIFARYFPIEEDMGAGLLLIILQALNLFSIGVGLVLGHLVNLIKHLRKDI